MARITSRGEEEEVHEEGEEEEEDEDGGFGLGDWLEMAETAEVVEQDDGNYEYFDDLSISLGVPSAIIVCSPRT